MSLFTLFALLITVTALLSYANQRFLRLPPTIGVMAAALVLSLLLIGLGHAGVGVDDWAAGVLENVDFSALLMKGMLASLLFAGALHVDMGSLLDRKWSILSLATIGVVVSTVLVGTAIWLVVGWFGIELPFVYALLFGSLISPTDPIAVLGILRSAGAPKRLESMIIGESLFNDGVGVVVFTMILSFIEGGHEVSASGAALLFVEEAIGGVMFGLGLGYVAYLLLKTVDDYTVEILITLAVVTGGYVLAGRLHTSGPIAMVVAGLFIGNRGRVLAMSETTREHVDTFWKLIDEILNAVLFVMIGLEVLVLDIRPVYLAIGLVAIPIVLAVRFLTVSVPINALRWVQPFDRHTVSLMTWGGIRGGISIALALMLPPSPYRDLIILVTYCVVVFSILVQGLTVGRAIRWAGVGE